MNFLLCWILLPRTLINSIQKFLHCSREFCQGNIYLFLLPTISLLLNAGPQKLVRFLGASPGRGSEHEENTSEMEVSVSALQCETTTVLSICKSMTEHTETHASYGSEYIYGVCSSVESHVVVNYPICMCFQTERKIWGWTVGQFSPGSPASSYSPKT